MASAPVDEMPLLCELGWHRADPLARWNAGYYFTTCGRCGRDLVRTAYGGWRVPKGFKIVWQAKPPESVTAAELVPDFDAERVNGDQMELPIQEVLRHMEAEEQALSAFADAAEEEPEPLPEPVAADEAPLEEVAAPEPLIEPAADTVPEAEAEPEGVEAVEAVADVEPDAEARPDPARSSESLDDAELMAAAAAASAAAKVPSVDDFMEDDWFMNDEPGYESWDRAAEYQIDTIEPEIVDDESEHVRNRSGKIRYGKEVDAVAPSAPATFLSMLRKLDGAQPESRIEDAPPGPAADAAAPSRSTAHAGAVATLVATFGVLLALIAAVGSGSDLRQTEAAKAAPSEAQAATAAQPQSAAPTPAALSRPEETGFVTASLLNCRTAPAEQAEPVRILQRGEPVRVLALEPAWASVSHRGRQCWASTRYLSAEQPL